MKAGWLLEQAVVFIFVGTFDSSCLSPHFLIKQVSATCYLGSQVCCFTLLGVHHAWLFNMFLSQMRVSGALHAIQLSHHGLYQLYKDTMKYPCGTWRRSAVRQCCGPALLNHFRLIVKTINRRYCQTSCLPFVYSLSDFSFFVIFQIPVSK